MFANYTEHGPELLSTAANKLRADFRLQNTNVTIANTLRRAILTQTPSVGFRTEPYDKSDVIIEINTTPLVNEMIAHRVGMIPLNADPLTFDPELFSFELDIENKGKEIRDVRASDFMIWMRNPENPLDKPIQVDTATFFPPDPVTGDTILITRLRPQWNPTAPNERIKLKARASVSSGTENIRWSAVCQASYEYTRDPDEAHKEEVFNHWIKTIKKVDDPSTLDPTRKAELTAEFNTMEIQRCYLTDGKGEPNDFTFHVESIGIQTVPDIVKAAIVSCEVLVSKYIDMDGLVPDNVRIQEGDSRFPSIDFIFQHETHTLGNLLETWIADNEVTGASEAAITYVGYKVPHPLRPEMFVRVGVKEGLDSDIQKQTARRVIARAARALKDEFRALAASWNALHGAPVNNGGVEESKGGE